MLQTTIPESISAVNINMRAKGHPSPETWRDQMIYFLLPDRFSDGKESQRPVYSKDNPQQFKALDKRAWMSEGIRFQGGTIQGITSKLDYLKGLGITALWIGPLFKQRTEAQTYHGYAVQNFLDVDPRFGTVEDLVELVQIAHSKNIYVILDTIVNHTGNNWSYKMGNSLSATADYRFQPPYDFGAWNTGDGKNGDTIRSRDDGVWPREFQNQDWYTRSGKIGNWDPAPWENPLHKDCEFRRGDFYDSKDLNYENAEVLKGIVQVYQYWIGLTDCDGFRMDAVKHIPWDASKAFCNAIHEYAESIGKENFLLAGEVTGGEQMERGYLDIFGRNIDAVLDVGEPAKLLGSMVKGFLEPSAFFDQYTGHSILGSHRETGRYHISILDDHDMVTREKQRFAAYNNTQNRYHQNAHAVGVMMTTLGVPCIYYGSEQSFDGNKGYHDASIEPYSGNVPFDDRYIRESMFGGTFGAFETSGCHFFDPNHPTYLRISAIAKIRSRQDKIGLALRRGRQYPQETSFLGRPFSIPGKGELIAWSRVQVDREVLIVLNTNGGESRGAEITVNKDFHKAGSQMRVLYRGDWDDQVLVNIDTMDYPSVPVSVNSEGRATVRLDLPPGEMAILA
jgi:glycosidase